MKTPTDRQTDIVTYTAKDSGNFVPPLFCKVDQSLTIRLHLRVSANARANYVAYMLSSDHYSCRLRILIPNPSSGTAPMHLHLFSAWLT